MWVDTAFASRSLRDATLEYGVQIVSMQSPRVHQIPIRFNVRRVITETSVVDSAKMWVDPLVR